MSRIFISPTSSSRRATQRLQLFAGEVAHVGVAGRRQLLGLGDVADQRLVLAEALDERFDLGQRLGVLAILRRLALHFARAEQPHQLFVTLLFCG